MTHDRERSVKPMRPRSRRGGLQAKVPRQRNALGDSLRKPACTPVLLETSWRDTYRQKSRLHRESIYLRALPPDFLSVHLRNHMAGWTLRKTGLLGQQSSWHLPSSIQYHSLVCLKSGCILILVPRLPQLHRMRGRVGAKIGFWRSTEPHEPDKNPLFRLRL